MSEHINHQGFADILLPSPLASNEADREELPSYTPQSLNDILPIYHADSNSTTLESYTLHQLSSTAQTLHPHDGNHDAPIYHSKTFTTGGFLNKKPHIIITKTPFSALQQPTNAPGTSARRLSLFRRSPSPPFRSSTPKPASTTALAVAEARFDIRDTGTTLSYTSPTDPITRRLELHNSSLQILKMTIAGSVHYWQPHPGNDAVFELVDEVEEIVARFIYSSPSDSVTRTNSLTPTFATTDTGAIPEKKKSISGFQEIDIGTLELVGARIPDEQAREEVLCSCIVVVERAKRRAMNVGYGPGKKGTGWGAMAGTGHGGGVV